MNHWWWRLTRYAARHSGALLGLVAVTLVGVALNVLQPWPVKWAIDHVLRHGAQQPQGVHVPVQDWLSWLPGMNSSLGVLSYLAAALVLLFVVTRLANMLKHVMSIRLGTRLRLSFGEQLFETLQRRSLTFHGSHATGDLVRRVENDAGCIRAMVMEVYLPLLTSLMTLASIGVVAWRVDPLLTLVAMAVTLPLGVVIYLHAGPMAERGYEQATQEGQLMAVAERHSLPCLSCRRFRRKTANARALSGARHP